MKTKSFYNAASLEDVVASFEERYGRSSEQFYVEHVASPFASLEGIPPYHRHLWASFYRDLKRLRGDNFTDRVRELIA